MNAGTFLKEITELEDKLKACIEKYKNLEDIRDEDIALIYVRYSELIEQESLISIGTEEEIANNILSIIQVSPNVLNIMLSKLIDAGNLHIASKIIITDLNAE